MAINYTPPVYNLTVSAWLYGRFPDDGDADRTELRAQKYILSRLGSTGVDSDDDIILGPVVVMRCPLEEWPLPWTGWGASCFEVPEGSGQYYSPFFRDCQHEGFGNEYAMFCCRQVDSAGDPGPPWPPPPPSPPPPPPPPPPGPPGECGEAVDESLPYDEEFALPGYAEQWFSFTGTVSDFYYINANRVEPPSWDGDEAYIYIYDACGGSLLYTAFIYDYVGNYFSCPSSAGFKVRILSLVGEELNYRLRVSHY